MVATRRRRIVDSTTESTPDAEYLYEAERQRRQHGNPPHLSENRGGISTASTRLRRRVLRADCADVCTSTTEMQTQDDSAVEKIVKVRRKAFDEVDFAASSQQATMASNSDAGIGSQFNHIRGGPIGPGSPLHRDGEQARIVEEVRRRQKLDHHNDEGYYEWIESNINVLWEGMGLGGSDLATRRPSNPYRETNRQTIGGMATSGFSSVSPQSESGEDSFFKSSSVYKKWRSVRFLYLILHHSMRAWRWLFDTCITRLARLERNVIPYSTTPVYRLEVTADDVLLLAFLLTIMGKYCATVQVVAAPSVAMILFSIMFVIWRIEGRQNSLTTRSRGRGGSNLIAEKAVGFGRNHEEMERALVERLREMHSITEAECSRFLRCSQYDEKTASQRAEGYMQWRSDCCLPSEIDDREQVPEMNEREFGSLFAEKDKELWNDAAKRAIEIDTNMQGSNVQLPQIICSYEDYFPNRTGKCNSDNEAVTSTVPRCTDNTRILQIFPARLDLSLAAAHTYSLAAALYLDRRFSRSIEEKVALFVDVRGGKGWTNPSPLSALPFIRSTAALLGDNYPERLRRLVLFPLPSSAAWVWSAAQKFLDADTRRKVVVIASVTEGLSKEIYEFISEKDLNTLEERRQSFFTLKH